MIRRRMGTSKVRFLLIQLLIFILLFIPIQGKNSLMILTICTSCLGLFIVAFSVVKNPAEKKDKVTLIGILSLSLLSIAWITLSGVIQLITESMV